MSDEYEIRTVLDFLALTPEQRQKCATDLVAWAGFMDQMQPLIDCGLVDATDTMIWVDDDRVGEVSGVNLVDRKTGVDLGRVNIGAKP